METTTARDIFKQRNRTPSIKQVRAVEAYLDANGRKSKAEALREVGYSEGVARHPDKVFESRAVAQILKDRGIDEGLGIEAVKRNIQARRTEMMYFPIFKEKSEAEDGEGVDFDNSEQLRGQQMTDADIRDFFLQNNCEVYRIEHGDQARRVYFYVQDGKTQLAAADMLFNLLGSYAPKKVESKNDHRVGVFSMADLRRVMREKGIKITDPTDKIIQLYYKNKE